MSDSKQQETDSAISPAPWPDTGGQWSDGEEAADMEECGLLQEMAEDDEDIDLYNEETFGMDLDVSDTGGDPTDPLLQFEEPRDPAPQALPVQAPLPPRSPPPRSPPPRYPPPRSPPPLPSPRGQPRPQPPPSRPQAPPGLWARGRGQRGGLSRTQMFEDPAVMSTVEGRPSIKSLDSAIVDCGTASYWAYMDPDQWSLPSYRKIRRTSGSILQDNAIVCVMEGPAGGVSTVPSYLNPPYPYSSARYRRGCVRGPYSNRLFGQRCPSQMYPMMLGSPVISQRPFTPQQHYNQTGGFPSPSSRPCPSSPLPFTPKMTQLGFSGNSLSSSCYSPSSNPLQRFRFPSALTRLHPQHIRLLSQRQPRSQRKPDSWDPYCDLMTDKERDWIIRLQMIQLQSENPHLDDYYYQEYYRRMEAKLAEEKLGLRSKRKPPKLTTPYITKAGLYKPVVHIEGCLGQVAVSTCFAPRRSINAVQAHSPSEEHKDNSRQRLDILMKIENLFVMVLEVEEVERVKASAFSQPEERRLLESTQSKVQHIYTQLLPDALDQGEELLSCLLVTKGKRLLARLLPFLSQNAALNVLRVITSHLPVLMSRDSDEALPVLYPSLQTVSRGLTFSQLIAILQRLTTSPPDSKDSECLSLVCRNKFGLSLLYSLLSQGERLLSSGAPLEPSIGDFEIWTDTVFLVARQLSQSPLVEPLLLPPNLLTLFCRYLDERTVHRLRSNIESATGLMALPS